MKVDANDLVPEIRLGIEKVERLIPAGIVDQDVGRPRLRLEIGDRFLHGPIIAGIDRLRVRRSATLGYETSGLHRALVIDIEDADNAAFPAKAPADRPPDAAGAAGDHGRLYRQRWEECRVGKEWCS